MVKRILIILLIVIFLTLGSLTVSAKEEDAIDEYENLLDNIPSDIADLLPDGLFSDNNDDIINAVNAMTSWEYILNTVFDILGINVKSMISIFAIIISLLVLCSLLNMLKNSMKNESLSRILDFCGSAIVVASLVELSKEPFSRCYILFDQLRLFVNSLSPFICAMYAMGGNVATAIVNNYGLIVFLTIFENVCIISLEIVIGICMSLTVASAFLKDGNLSQLTNSIKKTYTFFIGFLMLVFTTVISAQSLIATKADTLTSKTAKMLATQMIPLVGGTVGESLKAAGASIEYLRSNFGVAIIIILLLMILPSFISIVMYRITFMISNAIAGLLGCKREGEILTDVSSIYGYVIAIISIASITVLFLITLFAKCSSPLT